MNLVLNLLAQTTQPGTNPTTAAPPALLQGPMPYVVIVTVVLWVFVLRNRSNQNKSRTDQLAKLKPGQRIQTIGGILGTITQVNDKEITVKVDETNNVKIKFTRNAIHRVVDDDKEKTEAK